MCNDNSLFLLLMTLVSLLICAFTLVTDQVKLLFQTIVVNMLSSMKMSFLNVLMEIFYRYKNCKVTEVSYVLSIILRSRKADQSSGGGTRFLTWFSLDRNSYLWLYSTRYIRVQMYWVTFSSDVRMVKKLSSTYLRSVQCYQWSCWYIWIVT